MQETSAKDQNGFQPLFSDWPCSVTGPVSYKALLMGFNNVCHRHQIQLRKRYTDLNSSNSDSILPPNSPITTETSVSNTDMPISRELTPPIAESSSSESSQTTTHYPQRTRHPPDRFVDQYVQI